MLKRYRSYIIVVVVAVALLIVSAIASRVYFNSPTSATDAVVEEQKYYSVVDDSNADVLNVVVYPGKDTVVADSHDSLFLRSVTRYRPASWVNRLWLPSCFGCLAARLDTVVENANALPPLSRAAIPALLERKGREMATLHEHYTKQLEEIDYYLNSHSMQDEGFDIVVRRRDVVVHKCDSMAKLIALVEKVASSNKHLDVSPRARYEVVSDSIRLCAHFLSEGSGRYLLFRTDNGKMPSGVRPVYLGADSIGHGCLPATPMPELLDTVIIGKKDKTGRYVGNVQMICRDGSCYEGQVMDTLYEGSSVPRTIRHGAGVNFNDQYIRAGLWLDDNYKGEQPVYTANHIYGIDISRYQHEPSGGKTVMRTKKVKVGKRWKTVRVREKVVYPIHWDRLRITSLGHLSKKKVSGNVDYPISFVFIKSTEGASVQNKYYLSDYTQARHHGFKVGTYHFYSTKTYAASQAMYFIKNSRYNPGDLPPVLDVEPSPQQVAAMGGANALLGSVRKWLELVEKYRGVRPILYVSQTFVNRYFLSKYKDGEYLKKNYKVWIARYGEYKPDVHLCFWQLSPDGRVAGITGEVDINIFNGYADSFKAFCE